MSKELKVSKKTESRVKFVVIRCGGPWKLMHPLWPRNQPRGRGAGLCSALRLGLSPGNCRGQRTQDLDPAGSHPPLVTLALAQWIRGTAHLLGRSNGHHQELCWAQGDKEGQGGGPLSPFSSGLPPFCTAHWEACHVPLWAPLVHVRGTFLGNKLVGGPLERERERDN